CLVSIVLCLFPLFLFYSYGLHLDLHSFPTRRSSDLRLAVLVNREPAGVGAGADNQRSCVVGAQLEAARVDAAALGREQLLQAGRSEEHTSELQSLAYLVCRLLLEKKKKQI